MGSRRTLIAGNWKMNKTLQEARDFAVSFQEKVENVTDVDMLLCAPFTVLSLLKEELEETVIHMGAQNMHYEANGAFTGEISPVMLKDLACTYVLIGHSERREYFQETDELIARKIKAALEIGITPILCVGENLNRREAGEALDFVQSQIAKDLTAISPDTLKKVVIAYEPIWAIGTGKTASAQDAQEMCAGIRAKLATLAGPVAEQVQILYGGSVKSSNIAELMQQKDIDGALVGGASLEVDEFAKLIQNAR